MVFNSTATIAEKDIQRSPYCLVQKGQILKGYTRYSKALTGYYTWMGVVQACHPIVITCQVLGLPCNLKDRGFPLRFIAQPRSTWTMSEEEKTPSVTYSTDLELG